MNKSIKKITAGILTVILCLTIGGMTVFAKDVNSVGSAADDYKTTGKANATTNTSGITGYDDTQDKETVYQTSGVTVEELYLCQ